MLELSLIVTADGGFPIPPIMIAVAGIILALVIALASFWLFRGGGKKKAAQTPTTNGASDWQRQPVQNPDPSWNQQAGAPWNQQPAPAQQQGGWNVPNQDQQAAWNAPNAVQQQQQAPWSNSSPLQQPAANNPWAVPNAAPQQQQAPWNNPSPAQQQPAASSNPWNAPQAPGTPPPGQQPAWNIPNGTQPGAASNPWAMPGNSGPQPQQAANPWSSPAAAPWEAAAPAPAAQDPWGQPQPAAQSWGTPGGTAPAQPQAGQQPQTAYGGNSATPPWGAQSGFGSANNGAADPWGTPNQAQPFQGMGNPSASPSGNNPAVPAWQQQGGFGQSASGVKSDALFGAPADADKTMLRPSGAQGGIQGIVRVEEGKEPGRIYTVNKESLSIGRSRESDIFLEDLAVSRLHASIVNMGNGNYVLKDEGSANGTKVNGQIVSKYQTCPLQEGDRIQLGQTVLVFAKR